VLKVIKKKKVVHTIWTYGRISISLAHPIF